MINGENVTEKLTNSSQLGFSRWNWHIWPKWFSDIWLKWIEEIKENEDVEPDNPDMSFKKILMAGEAEADYWVGGEGSVSLN